MKILLTIKHKYTKCKACVSLELPEEPKLAGKLFEMALERMMEALCVKDKDFIEISSKKL